MKKLKIIGAILVLLVTLVGAWCGRIYLSKIEPQRPVKKASSVKEYGKLDLEYLKNYDLEIFETTLPVLFIDTKGQRLSKENKVWVSIGVLNTNGDQTPNLIDQNLDYVAPITINYRGASSYVHFDKSQYRIKFYKEEGSTKAKDYEFLGMGKHSEWVLNGPFLDKTLLRNRFLYGMAREIFSWAPDSRFTEVFVDGKYQGVYLAVEPVTNGETRLNISKFGLLSGETSYIVKRDRIGTEVNPLIVYGKTAGKTSNDLFIDYPSAKRLTNEQRDWIEEDISQFERVLYSDGFADPEDGYSKYLDVNTFVDYFIFNEVVMNHDAGNLSTYLYKELGGKLQIAVWDFNNAYDNYQGFKRDFSEFYLPKNAWFSELVKDRAFVDKVTARYEELRGTVLKEENMNASIDDYIEELGDAIERNYAIWGYSFELILLIGEGRDLKSYDEAVTQLKQAIHQRLEFLDVHMKDLYMNCVN